MSTESTTKCDGCQKEIQGFHMITVHEQKISSEKSYLGLASPFHSLDFCTLECLDKWCKEHV